MLPRAKFGTRDPRRQAVLTSSLSRRTSGGSGTFPRSCQSDSSWLSPPIPRTKILFALGSIVFAFVVTSSWTFHDMSRSASPPTEKAPSRSGGDLRSPATVASTPIKTATNATQKLERLRLVTFNIAGCQPSREAPRNSDWNNQKGVTEGVREEILSQDPDIIALQECPGDESWANAYFRNYTAVGATWSHADRVLLMVRKGVEVERISIQQGGDEEGSTPAILAKLTYKSRALLVASVHLAPFKEGATERRLQIQRLLQTAAAEGTCGSVPLIIAGDMNMRQAEDQGMEVDLQLTDLWKEAGSNRDNKFTWDTKDHGTFFNRYYGDSTREYTARYDRIYSTRPLVESLNLHVLNFQLIANKPLENKYHFLSDHFGITTSLELNWTAIDDTKRRD